jgi:hypothetical protein
MIAGKQHPTLPPLYPFLHFAQDSEGEENKKYTLSMLSLVGAISAQSAVDLVSAVNWQKPTWDLFILLFFLVSAFVYGVSLGRERIFAIMVSIYMALAVVATLPNVPSTQSLFVVQAATFLGIFFVLVIVLSRSSLLKSNDEKSSMLQGLIFSVLHVGLLISVTLSYLPKDATKDFSELTQILFLRQPALFLWVIAPILAAVIFGRTKQVKKYKYEV